LKGEDAHEGAERKSRQFGLVAYGVDRVGRISGVCTGNRRQSFTSATRLRTHLDPDGDIIYCIFHDLIGWTTTLPAAWQSCSYSDESAGWPQASPVVDFNSWQAPATAQLGRYEIRIQYFSVEVGEMWEAEGAVTFYVCQATGSLSMTKWHDLNANGIRDHGEPGIPFWKLSFTDPFGSTFNRLTDANGNVVEDSLPIGHYSTWETVKPGWTNSTPVALSVGVLTGQETEVSFGNYQTGSIGDYVWLDANRDGVQDNDEVGIPEVTLALWLDSNDDGNYDTQVSTETTDDNGWYLFDELPPGKYLVDVDESTLPAGAYVLTTNNEPFPYELAPEEDMLDADFGYFKCGVEKCNGIDDDCDDETDEDFPVDEACDGDDGDECKNGTWSCGDDGWSVECLNESVTDIAETCNGLDDDCDGDIDEDFPLGEACDGADDDRCKTGTLTCRADGSGVECVNESDPNIEEICDGQDNDCDGDIDEDFPLLGEACDGADSDMCANGHYECHGPSFCRDPNGCNQPIYECINDFPMDIVEICDGIDNDCDGMIDEGLGTSTCGVGACVVTTDNCIGGQPQTCEPGAPVDEICDLVDNDCDGAVDEDRGTTSCGTGLCSASVEFCVDGQVQNCEPGIPTAEVCDLADNDCDGAIDEDLGTTTCGVGSCEITVDNCVDGAVQTCVPGDPHAETCDLMDNDCDGSVDEDLGSTTCGVGACAASTENCINGEVQTCVPGDAGTEICDFVDNDCDGAVDEDLGTTTCGVGACEITVDNCDDGEVQTCTPNPPGTEVCDFVDNDCDGAVDEDLGTTTCGVGACEITIDNCDDGEVQTCTPNPPGTETCDLVDNDCDGSVDEELGSTSCGVGACAASTDNCINGEVQTCVAGDPSDEICDLIDNDCDGSIDEDLGSTDCGIGACAASTDNCINGEVQTCTPGDPADEVCDLIDNDCDGSIDEDLGSTDCGVGACAASTENCINGEVQTCVAGNPSDEICDLIDNDCDGSIDEDLGSTDCGVGACAASTDNCINGEVQTCVAGNPSDEICDLIDNDCDGSVDEELGSTDCGVGACAASTDNCINGEVQTCAPGDPADEVCDLVDNDCDGSVDEDLGSTDCGVGACAASTENCINGEVQTCVPGSASDEVCDLVDNDCDGSIDEDLGSTDCGVGACAASTDNCINGVVQTCTPGDPADEVCDLVDNDCDGSVDEDLGSTSCGVGSCVITVENCVDGEVQSCVPGESHSEMCNLMDDDCDGEVDEDLGSTTCGIGACVASTENCIDGEVQTCVPGEPADELCDLIDNDCDGEIDEDLGSTTCGVGECEVTIDNCGDGSADLDAFAAGLPDQVSKIIAHPGTGFGSPSYYDVTILGDSILAGVFDAYCVDTDTFITPGTTYLADVYSSYEDIPDGIMEFPENLDLVNYIINQGYVGTASQGGSAFTYGDVQRAIWTLIDDGLVTNGLGSWTQVRVDEILDDALANGEGYEPDCDGVVGVILDPVTNNQLTIVQATMALVAGTCDPNQECVPGDPTEEICDGLDNDCDGEVDEGLGTTTCGLGACENTIDNCVAGETQSCDPFLGADDEICDLIDNDCDGELDEDLGSTTCGVGECEVTIDNCGDGSADLDAFAAGLPAQVSKVIAHPGTGFGAPSYYDVTILGQSILAGVFDAYCVDTDTYITPGTTYLADVYSSYEDIPDGIMEFPENLDLVNYILNMGYVGTPSQDGSLFTYGDVQRAIWTLIDDGLLTNGLGAWSQARVDEILADATADGDGYVPDCDGYVGVILDPVTNNQLTIVQVTMALVAGTCDPNQQCVPGDPTEEICDGLDNDCDGEIDEGLGSTSCGVGACATTVDNCVAGQVQSCVPGTPVAESCDLVDNDCDGSVDEDLGTSTCGVGECENTVDNCVAGQAQTCVPGDAATELCDALDNDCDGSIDEGFNLGESCSTGGCGGENLEIWAVSDENDPLIIATDNAVLTGSTMACNFEHNYDGMAEYKSFFVDTVLAINDDFAPDLLYAYGAYDGGDWTGMDDTLEEMVADGDVGSYDMWDVSAGTPLDLLPGDLDGVDVVILDAAPDTAANHFVVTEGSKQVLRDFQDSGGKLIVSAYIFVYWHDYVNYGYKLQNTDLTDLVGNVLPDITQAAWPTATTLEPSPHGAGETLVTLIGAEPWRKKAKDPFFHEFWVLDASPVVSACYAEGEYVCADDGTAECTAETILPGDELCGDGIDNDCDCEADEGFDNVGNSCEVGVGACYAEGEIVCSADGLSETCDAVAGDPVDEVCGDGVDNDCDGELDEGCVCPHTIGYWKNHPNDWPVEEVAAGGVTYSKAQAIQILKNAKAKDATHMLTAQLIAAKLSVADGGPVDVLPVIEAADAFLVLFPYGSNPQGDDRVYALAVKDQLDGYNNGSSYDFCECEADCDDKECGSDGCGGSCGDCDDGFTCNSELFECECVPADEICDGKDNDCDGDVDEGLGTTTCGVGACQTTSDNCVNGVANACVPGNPGIEVCDLVDNDCDGSIDEDLGVTTCGQGICQVTVENCVAGETQSCAPATPSCEVCDGLDNDCDGLVDEGLGTTTCGVGACKTTVQNCVNGSWQVCSAGTPGTEVCDGIDNDCDSAVDEGLGSLTCGEGACENTVQACVNGQAQQCTPGTPGAEVCDDLTDNDCDGSIDEGCDSNDDCELPDECVTLAEAFARDWIAIDTPSSQSSTVTIHNLGPVEVCLDEHLLFISDPTQSMTNGTEKANGKKMKIAAGGKMNLRYAPWTYPNGYYQPYLNQPPWWCVEYGQLSTKNTLFGYYGEQAPEMVQYYIDNKTDTDNDGKEDHVDWGGKYGTKTLYNIWGYQNSHGVLTAGKVAGAAGPGTIAVVLTSHNMGAFSAQGVLVDTLPAGYWVDNFSLDPDGWVENNDGTVTMYWNIDLEGYEDKSGWNTTTVFDVIEISYDLHADWDEDGKRIELPRASITFCDGQGERTSNSALVIAINVDVDGDGFGGCQDCDNGDEDVYPGADEICDGADNDCDGDTDEGCPVCGNGIIEDGEICDDGDDNENVMYACQTDCTLSIMWPSSGQTTIAYEDLPLYGGNDWDYNDWVIELEVEYIFNADGVKQMRFYADPWARGAAYHHSQGIAVAMGTYSSTGTYQVKHYNTAWEKTGEEAEVSFGTDEDIAITMFADTWETLPPNSVNGDKGVWSFDANTEIGYGTVLAPKVGVEFHFDTALPMEPALLLNTSPGTHCENMPYDLYLLVNNTGEYIANGDTRMLCVPDYWDWPSEKQSIWDVYEGITPAAGGPVFDEGWYLADPVGSTWYAG
jgi:LruC domain-containing protein